MTRKRLVAICVSLLLLLALFASIDLRRLGGILAGIDWMWFTLGLLLFVPQVAVIARRWMYITAPMVPLRWGEATRQVLAAGSLNLVLPSKLGDLAKGVILYRRGSCRLGDGLHVVVFEKLMDIAALSFWMIAGWVLFPALDWWVLGMLLFGMVVLYVVCDLYFERRSRVGGLLPGRLKEIARSGPRVMRLIDGVPRRRGGIALYSLAIWFLHLIQIHLFLLAVGVELGMLVVFAQMPIALFAGLLPLTVAGFGIRDWAIVVLFASPAHPPEALVAGALLISLRYVIPAVAGLPFLGHYLTLGRQALESEGKTLQ